MIESITIRNLQTHRDTTIDFCPGVNAVVGITDSGKSGLFRAFDWVVNNQPSGVEDMTYDETWMEVVLRLNDVTVTRRRDKTDNVYVLEMLGEKPRTFRGFGRNVPQPVQDALNMSDINFCSQRAASFLLSDSPPVVAKFINKISNLEIIDQSKQRNRDEIGTAEKEKSFLERSLEDSVRAVNELSWVETADGELAALEAVEIRIIQNKKKQSRISRTVDQLKIKKRQLMKFEFIDDAQIKINNARQNQIRIQTKIAKKTLLNSYLQSLYRLQDDQESTVVLEAAPEIQVLIKKNAVIDSKDERCTKIENFIKNINKEKTRKKLLEETLTELQTKFNKLMPNACPLCGRTG